MPAFRGKVSLPTPAVANTVVSNPPPLRLARASDVEERGWQAARARVVSSDDEQWQAALIAARQRAVIEEEERTWQAAVARARAQAAAQEEREWAALRARSQAAVWPPPRIEVARPARRLHTWP